MVVHNPLIKPYFLVGGWHWSHELNGGCEAKTDPSEQGRVINPKIPLLSMSFWVYHISKSSWLVAHHPTKCDSFFFLKLEKRTNGFFFIRLWIKKWAPFFSGTSRSLCISGIAISRWVSGFAGAWGWEDGQDFVFLVLWFLNTFSLDTRCTATTKKLWNYLFSKDDVLHHHLGCMKPL